MTLSKLSLGKVSKTEKERQEERIELNERLLTCPIPYDESSIEVTKELSIFHRNVLITASCEEKNDGRHYREDIYEGLDVDETHRLHALKVARKGYEYSVDMNILNELLLEHISKEPTQKLLTYAFDNLISLKEKELPEEFNEYNWEYGSRAIWDQMYGYPFVSKSNPDYYIIFGNAMTHFITDKFWDELVSKALINLKNIKREDIKLNTDVKMKFITCLLETDCNPPKLLHRFPDNPRKLIKVMVATYRNYFDVGHLDFDALSIATKRCLLSAIQKAINTYEGDPYHSILC